MGSGVSRRHQTMDLKLKKEICAVALERHLSTEPDR